VLSHHGEILDVPLIFVKVMERGDEENQHRYFAAPVSADPRLTPWDRIMLITICRLYDSYADANRVVIGLETAGIALAETSLISNNSDSWYRTGKASNVVALRKQGASGDARPLPALSPCWRFQASAWSSAPDGLRRCWAA